MALRVCHLLSAVIVSLIGGVACQNPIFNNPINDPLNQQGSGNLFFFDSNSDCNTGIRNINNVKATIEGHGGSAQTLGPESCTIILKSEGQFEGTILHIEVRSMDIRDCTTTVSIYDGEGQEILLDSYNCRTSAGINQRAWKTSGNTATFIMNRQDVEQWNFDVEIIINPIRGGLEPGFENNYGTDFYFDKFDQLAIVGMIGGFYLLVLIICTVVMICAFRKFHGKTKEWETHQLATMKTGAGFDGRSQMSHGTNAWSTAQSRGPASQYSRGYTDPYARKHTPASEDGDSGVFRYDDTFQRRRLMNEEREKSRNGPPTYASRNDSYVEPESPEFTERVITPRVRTANRRQGRPPSYEEAISDHPSEHSSEEESEEESSDESVGKKPLSSEEGSERSRSSRSRSETESEEESEEESSEEDSRRGRGARGGRRKPRHNRHRVKPKKASSRDSRDGDEGPSRRNAAAASQPLPPQVQPVPYPAYPPGQFVPVMAGPPQFQMVPSYPAPRYPEEGPPSADQRPQIQPTDPPVYSYLVRRGYTPMDPHNQSSGSVSGSQRSGAGRLEEPDIRLETGVEYMRR